MTTRFAPSPTGHLHLGHAYAAWVAKTEARKAGGTYLLRWEDIDTGRCRPEYETAILEDLEWLDLLPDEEAILRQSNRFSCYKLALQQLTEMNLVYPCFCTRQEIAAASQAPQGPEGPLYPGSCRKMTVDEAQEKISAGGKPAWRLRMDRAIEVAGSLTWRDIDRGPQEAHPEAFGDVVLARKETPTSYHLAVTVDDAAQGITLVTRGEDLFNSTHIHRLLQALLELPQPCWKHHRLITDGQGKRLAKRDRDTTLRELRSQGVSPHAIWERLVVSET